MTRWITYTAGAMMALGLGTAGTGAMAQSDGCPTGDYRLPTSKLCAGAVASAVPPATESFISGIGLYGCKPVIWDGPIMGKAMVYRAAQCNGKPAQIVGAVGAQTGGLDFVGGGLEPDTTENAYQVALFVDADPSDPLVTLTATTKEAMEYDFTPEEIARCTPRRAPEFGPNAWVVDDPVAAQAHDPASGPRSACGIYGYTQESTAFWQVNQGMALFFELGQDAYAPLDPGSLIFIGQNSEGKWGLLKDFSAEHRASMGPPEPYKPKTRAGMGPMQIANLPGAWEDPYDTVRGWTVTSATRAKQLEYCAGETANGNMRFRMGSNGQQWQVAVSASGVDAGYQGQLVVDGQAWPLRGGSDGMWVFGTVTRDQIEAIGQGNLMVLDINRWSFDLPLRGSAATVLKIEECVANKGVRP